MKTYRVALLGCGGRGRSHGRAYRAHPRTQLVATCDLVASRLHEVSEELGIGPQVRYTDLDEMLDREQPDIVAIPTATEFHFPLAMRVLAHGCHVDVEKPVCEHLHQADELLTFAARQGREIAVHHQWRTSPFMSAVRAALREGRIGDVRFIYASGKGYYGGYGLPNIGTHLLNQLFALLGPARVVSGHVLTDGRDITPADVLQAPMGMGIMAGEHITALLEFAGGTCATLLQHRFDRIDLGAHVVEIYGSEGRLLWRPHECFWLPTPDIPPGPYREHLSVDNAHWEPLPPIMPEAWCADMACALNEFSYVQEYVQALDEGRSHPCSGEEGRHVLEVINGIYWSAIKGTRVTLTDMPRSHPLTQFRLDHGLTAEPDPAPRPYLEWLAAEDKRLGR